MYHFTFSAAKQIVNISKIMISKVDSGKNGSEDANSGQLLRDIEAISKALYLHSSPPSKGLLTSSRNRSKSAGKTRLFGSKSNTKVEDVLHKDKKASIWNWKKPLQALSHIRNQKFRCSFYLHVHSIEGLPLDLNSLDLVVHWKRKDEVMHTRPSKVDHGMAEFEQTLMYQSSVYGHRSGSQHSAKYETKHFLVHPSIVGAYRLDIGKYWVDLTNLLPHTLEELEGDKRSGNRKTSFKLTGKANGAILNVSFGYSVLEDMAALPSNINQNISNTIENVTNSDTKKLRRVGSVPNLVNHRSHLSSHSQDVKVLDDVFSNAGLGISRSINLLYQKLDEAKMVSLPELDLLSVQGESRLNSTTSIEENFGNECDVEFTVIDKGIELTAREKSNFEESSDQAFDGSVVQTFQKAEIMNDVELASTEGIKENSKEDGFNLSNIDAVVNECKYNENDVHTEESTIKELNLNFQSSMGPESTEFKSQSTPSEILAHEINMKDKLLSGNENYMEEESNFKATKIVGSLNLDDITESIASDFLKMLGVDHSPVGLSSDSDLESPRERLLRQFEREALASGDSIFHTDANIVDVEFVCHASTAPAIEDLPENLTSSLIIEDAEQEQKKTSTRPSLMSKRKVKVLEKLETEALMREWGLNETTFQNSPLSNSGGFGSPIYVPYEESIGLPPLGEGLGSVLQTKNRGFLRSMNPSLFKNVKNGGSLIMQVSCPVVLPAELGSSIIEILQHLASIGVEQLSMQINNLMPLEDITGKTMLQVAWETASLLEVLESKRALPLHSEFEAEQDSSGKKKEAKEFWSAQTNNSLHANSLCCEMDPTYVSLIDFPQLAMDKIEGLSIIGLRIQSGISPEEAPSSLYPRGLHGVSFNVKEGGVEVNKLLGLSMTLNEWLRLDAGIFSDEYHKNEHTLKILAAHHAKRVDLFGEKCGLLGDNLTIALMLQLRDPLRDYEPVGAPMLALFQVERAYYLPNHEVPILLKEKGDTPTEYLAGPIINEKKEDVIPQFKITESHVTGLNTEPVKRQLLGTVTQQQSGYRWLLASGMGKTNKHASLKSKALVRVSSLSISKKQPIDTLWSISSCVEGSGGKLKELTAQIPHLRNPDIIFLNEGIRL